MLTRDARALLGNFALKDGSQKKVKDTGELAKNGGGLTHHRKGWI